MSTTMCGYCGEFEAVPESKLTRVACAVCALRHERASSILDAIKAAMKAEGEGADARDAALVKLGHAFDVAMWT